MPMSWGNQFSNPEINQEETEYEQSITNQW